MNQSDLSDHIKSLRAQTAAFTWGSWLSHQMKLDILEVREVTMMLSIITELGLNILLAVVRLSACGEEEEEVGGGGRFLGPGPYLVSILSQGPPGGEGEQDREVTLEYSAQQPAQSPGPPYLLLAAGKEGPAWVGDEQSGRVARQELGEKFHPGERRAKDHSSRQHVVSAGTQ